MSGLIDEFLTCIEADTEFREYLDKMYTRAEENPHTGDETDTGTEGQGMDLPGMIQHIGQAK